MAVTVLFVIFIGLAGGIAVGSGFVAFLTVLGVIPRLIHLTKTLPFLRHYEWAVSLGAVGFSFLYLRDISFHLPAFLLLAIGLFCGIFIGMLAAALFEVLNVMPILSKRIGIEEGITGLLMAIVFGKIIGSLFQWLFFVKF